ncbi:MAG: hypothetical protein CM1200mP12_00920 [Gammaproteobacteria bacterium]|nr:MAG: hypothetical protein CM1200mP12_00920 [Gammaproteobacteria bacterium]
MALKNNFTVVENLRFSPSIFNSNEEKIISSLKEVDLFEYRERASSDLSMGQLKRLA